jgi:hypothetical protein
MRFQLMTLKLVTMIGVVLGVTAARAAPFLIVGDDAKAGFADGKPVVSPPGNDAVLIVDVANPLDPHMWNDPAVKGPLQSDPYRSGAPICPAFSCRPMARWPR